jgi:MFS family permease
VVLFAIVAGTIGDLVDRRRFLLVTETFMLIAAAALGALTIAGLVTPWVLLALVFAVGTGQALTSPTWQTLQPELVSPAERTQAISLGSVNQNLARAVGPAIGGALLAATSAGTVFLVNAASFVVVIGVIAAWRWAARAPDAPRLRARLSADALLTAGSIGMAVVTLLLAYAYVIAVVAVALVVGGACWILALSTLNSLYQLSLPRWIKARGMSFYLMVFQGGGAVGAAVMGVAAEHAGLTPTLTIAAAGLALGPLAALRWRFRPIPPEDLLPAGDWPAPHLAEDQTPDGPVLVSVEYRAQPGLEEQLMTALQRTRFSRRRTGATSWRAWQDASDPSRILEQFVVASWDEHLRQHERVTKRDQGRLDRIHELTDPAHPVTVTHWLAVIRRKTDAPVPSASASPLSSSSGTTAPPAP